VEEEEEEEEEEGGEVVSFLPSFLPFVEESQV
jgi:hypothetical protein